MGYLFALMGVELITLNERAREALDPRIVETHFEDLFTTMLTLVQFVCLDSVGAIYRPIIHDSDGPALVTYFMVVIVVLAIVLMNIITAAVVQSAQEMADRDREAHRLQEDKRKKKMMLSWRSMFA